MKKERIKLMGMTMITIIMVIAVYLAFPLRYARLHEKETLVLVSRMYIYRADSDWVLLSNGKAVYLKEEKDAGEIYGRILISATEGFM